MIQSNDTRLCILITNNNNFYLDHFSKLQLNNGCAYCNIAQRNLKTL